MDETTGLDSDTALLQQRNRELTILNAIAAALNAQVDLEQALRAALAQVAALLDLRTGWIWLLRDETGEAYLAAAQNLPPGLRDTPRLMEGNCLCLDTFRKGDLRGAANVNVLRCSRLQDLVDGAGGLRYHASIPLYAQGKRLGVLNLASPEWRELSPADLRLLSTIGDLLGIAVERARLFAHSLRLGAVEERNRLAREIHDTIAQGLAAITLQLETADALLEGASPPERVRPVVEQALQLTRANLEEARRSVLDLRAAPLDGQTLAQALARLAERCAADGGPRVTTDLGVDRALPHRIEAGLYRIAQEALTNITRHADARQVILRLTLEADAIRLTIRDDGRGFDPRRVEADRFGLVGLNERAHLLGGRLRLHSQRGVGTEIDVTVPLDAQS